MAVSVRSICVSMPRSSNSMRTFSATIGTPKSALRGGIDHLAFRGCRPGAAISSIRKVCLSGAPAHFISVAGRVKMPRRRFRKCEAASHVARHIRARHRAHRSRSPDHVEREALDRVVVEHETRGEHEEVIIEHRAGLGGDGLRLGIHHGNVFRHEPHPARQPVGGLRDHVIRRLQTRRDQREAGLVEMLRAGVDDGDLGTFEAIAQAIGQRAARRAGADDHHLRTGLDRRAADGGAGVCRGQRGKRATGGGQRQEGAAGAVEIARHGGIPSGI
jgi:hypothetical protein